MSMTRLVETSMNAMLPESQRITPPAFGGRSSLTYGWPGRSVEAAAAACRADRRFRLCSGGGGPCRGRETRCCGVGHSARMRVAADCGKNDASPFDETRPRLLVPPVGDAGEAVTPREQADSGAGECARVDATPVSEDCALVSDDCTPSSDACTPSSDGCTPVSKSCPRVSEDCPQVSEDRTPASDDCTPSCQGCTPSYQDCTPSSLDCTPSSEDCTPSSLACTPSSWNRKPSSPGCTPATQGCTPITRDCTPSSEDCPQFFPH